MRKYIDPILRQLFNLVIYVFIGMRVSGKEKVPRQGPVIMIFNHESYFDPPLVGTAVSHRFIHFMAKEELFRHPVMRYILRYMKSFPVRRGVTDRTAIVESLKVLKSGEILGIFPEGTRHKKGVLGRFHDGFASLAIKTGVPVLPVAIINSRPLPKKKGPVKVIFGDLVFPPTAKATDKEAVQQFCEQMRQTLHQMLIEHGGTGV